MAGVALGPVDEVLEGVGVDRESVAVGPLVAEAADPVVERPLEEDAQARRGRPARAGRASSG